MSGPHSLRARQRNELDLAANEKRLELLALRRVALEAEELDLWATRRALLAQSVALRDADGQL